MPFNGGFYEILHLIEFVQQIYTPKILAFTVNKQLYFSPLFFLQLFIDGKSLFKLHKRSS